MGEQTVAKLLASLDEIFLVRYRSQLAGEVLHVDETAVARTSGLQSILVQQKTANAQALALHLIPHGSWVGEVHVGVARIPTLAFEVGVLAQRKRDGLAFLFGDVHLLVDEFVFQSFAGGESIAAGRQIDFCTVVHQGV